MEEKSDKVTNEIVISTRIRLARNLAAYPFPDKLSPKLSKEIVHLVWEELDQMDLFRRYDMDTIEAEYAKLLQEQHLISPALLKRKSTGCAFITPDNSVSIMVNEEDHLREQYIIKGYKLYNAYERICGIDDRLGEVLDFAYDDKLGYLTACPSNLGTGMRASVMLFLPALTKNGELKKVLPSLKEKGLVVRGAYGEGTAAEGFSYQVSNERTLGVSEGDLLKVMNQEAKALCKMERKARQALQGTELLLCKDECLRAYGTLTNCAMLPQKELTDCMIKIRIGIALGFFQTADIIEYDEFFEDMRPASFSVKYGLLQEDEADRERIRAEVAQKEIARLVTRVS